MISLKGKENVEKSIMKVLEKSAVGMNETINSIGADIADNLYGEDVYDEDTGIEINSEMLKKEFGSEDNPPSPFISDALKSDEAQKRLEDIFFEKMEGR